MLIPFAEFAPDQPAFGGAASAYIRNVVPVTAGSYGPFRAMEPFSGALAARCQGAMFMRDTDGASHGWAGTAAALYRLSAGSTSWVDETQVGGYTTAIGERWAFALHGRTVIATNFGDPIQQFTLGTSALFADLAAAAPQARHVAIVRGEWTMVANTYDGTDGNQPQRVWWSAQGDPTNWPTIGSPTAAQVQSDRRDLFGQGGWINGLASSLSAADVAVFQEKAVLRGQYVGPPYVFAFQPVEAARGCPAPGSIITVGPLAYYLGEDGFYVFDGASSVGIGTGKLDKWFWSDVRDEYLYRVSAAYDPQAKIVYWSYPGSGSTSGLPNRILAFHTTLNRWTVIDHDAEILCNSAAFGYTLDQLDAFGALDALPFALDSRAWSGDGRTLLAGFDADHKLGIFSGASLAATIDTPEGQINERGRAYVSGARPVVDTAAALVAPATRNLLSVPPTYASAVAQNVVGDCPMRSDGRFHRFRATIPAGTTWTHAQGVIPTARASGYR